MKTNAYILFLLLLSSLAYSQSHELGVALGGTNYIGDIGSGAFVDPNSQAFGLVYKLNRSTRHSYRLSYMRYDIEGIDAESGVIHRELRGLQFQNVIDEFSLGLEYSFVEFNLHENGPQATAYIHIGFGFLNYSGITYNSNQPLTGGRDVSFSIPMSLGYKFRVSRKFIMSAEISAKYTGTDNLDGSQPDSNFSLVGNDTNNDWFVFTGVTLTYTFGKRPCLCKL